jgi:hypothetical protein
MLNPIATAEIATGAYRIFGRVTVPVPPPVSRVASLPIGMVVKASPAVVPPGEDASCCVLVASGTAEKP